MPVRAHHHQIRLELLGVGHDGVFGPAGVPYHHFDGNLLPFQFGGDLAQVLAPASTSAVDASDPIHLAGHALFHVQQVELGMVLLGHGGGVCDGLPVPAGVIQRDQNFLIERAG